MQYFCGHYSTRCGSLIASVSTFAQTALLTILVCLCRVNSSASPPDDRTHSEVNQGQVDAYVSTVVSHYFMNVAHQSISDHFYLILFACAFMMVISLLSIYGSLKCVIEITMTYCFFEAVRLAILSCVYLMVCRAIRRNSKNVQALILFVVFGLVFLITLWYLWACVFSFVDFVLTNRKKTGSKRIHDVILGHCYYLKNDSMSRKVASVPRTQQFIQAWVQELHQ